MSDSRRSQLSTHTDYHLLIAKNSPIDVPTQLDEFQCLITTGLSPKDSYYKLAQSWARQYKVNQETQQKIDNQPKLAEDSYDLILPTSCSTWHGRGDSCIEPATQYLVDPNGYLIPNGHVCSGHAYSILLEYKEKLDEHWTSIPIYFSQYGPTITLEAHQHFIHQSLTKPMADELLLIQGYIKLKMSEQVFNFSRSLARAGIDLLNGEQQKW